MQPFAIALQRALNERQEAFSQGVLQAVASASAQATDLPKQTPEDLLQMVRGFFALLNEALEDREPKEIRTFYIESVMPGLRDSGASLAEMIGGCAVTLTNMAADVAPRVSEEVRPQAIAWVSKFIGDYLRDIVLVWQAPPEG